MRKVALVSAGGFCGTLARYVLMAPLLGLAGLLMPTSPGGFPYDIFAINLSGAFALGLLYGLVERGAAISPDVRLAVGTGFLGAYTTFSTFVAGGDTLLAAGNFLPGILYLCGSVALGVFCAWAGTQAAASIASRWRLARVAWMRGRRFERGFRRSTGRSESPLATRPARRGHTATAAHPARTPHTHPHQHRREIARHVRVEEHTEAE